MCLRCCCSNSDSEEDGDRTLVLLNAISAARSIFLDDTTTYVLIKYSLNNMPTMNRLTHLDMRIPRLCAWTILFNILDSSPNLQALTIQKDCFHYEDSPFSRMGHLQNLPEDFDWMEPHTPPTCLRSHLQHIVLTGYFWMRCDMKAMKYVLVNAKVLKKVTCKARRTGVKGEAAFWMEIDEYAKMTLPSCTYEVPSEEDE